MFREIIATHSPLGASNVSKSEWRIGGKGEREAMKREEEKILTYVYLELSKVVLLRAPI